MASLAGGLSDGRNDATVLYLTAGTKIRAFTLTECLGKGGMSAVWQAHHAETGQDYALKILHGSVVDDEQVRLRFFEEGLIQSRVAHPNVVAVKGRIEEHPVHALVMEFVDGPSLASYITERPDGLFLPEVKAIATGILSGLNAAHRRGIVHRDVKPSNVLLARDFYTITPKLTDFGIAKVKYGRLKTVTSSPMGTPHFMSPEQLRDSKRVTLQTDIYSFGITLYHMVTGQYPYDGDDLNALMLRIIQGGHQPPSHYREDLPPELDELIERCVAPRAQDRPENCREVLESILAVDWNQPESPARKAAAAKRANKPTGAAPPPAKGKRSTGTSRQVAGASPGTAARESAAAAERSFSGPRPAVPQVTPPPIPAVAPSRPTPAPTTGRRPPAARPSGTLDEVASGEWQLSSDHPEVDLSREESALRFKRRSVLPLALGLLLLAAVAAVGTKLILDWRAGESAAEQAAGTEASAPELVEVAPPAGSDGLAVTPTPSPTPGALANAPDASPPVASRDETSLATASPTATDGAAEPGASQAGTDTPPDVPARDEAAAVAANDEGSSVAEAAVAEPAPTTALLVPAEDSAATDRERAAQPESAALEAETAGPAQTTDAPARTEPAVGERTEAVSSRDRDRELDRQSTERAAEQRDALVGRERERAAEEAWRAREGSTPTDTALPPTIRATGPEDDPAGLGTNPATVVTTPPTQTSPTAPPQQGTEELSPTQINRTLGQSRSQLRACFDGYDVPPIEMRIRITPDGRVSFARAIDQSANGQVVGCLVRELGRLQFDTYDGAAVNIRRTFNRIGPM